MRVYCVQTEGLQDTIVFARSYDDAADVFVTHYMAARESAPGAFSVSRTLPEMPADEREQLEEARRRGIRGVGYFDHRGWTIDPPDA